MSPTHIFYDADLLLKISRISYIERKKRSQRNEACYIITSKQCKGEFVNIIILLVEFSDVHEGPCYCSLLSPAVRMIRSCGDVHVTLSNLSSQMDLSGFNLM